MAIKPSLPKGTRDFLPQQMRIRNHILSVLRENFELYGFEPVETPALERIETLTGKYGEEGDRLIFKILPRGRKFADAANKAGDADDPQSTWQEAVEEALRYDLTVPFARLVTQHRNELVFPFKRYQMQPVWRADRPQKGRFREFMQCDADVVGPASPLQDLECLCLYHRVFQELALPVKILLNQRPLLEQMALALGMPLSAVPGFTVELDKLDKTGTEATLKQMANLGLQTEALEKLRNLIELPEDNATRLSFLADLLGSSAAPALAELRFLWQEMESLGMGHNLLIEPSLARGLDYYTGAIFEVRAQGLALGSLGGGGRYGNLTEMFGGRDLPGVGLSFGLDRIQLALEERGESLAHPYPGIQVLIVQFREEERSKLLDLAENLRNMGVRTEVYPQASKLKKQLDYANRREIPYVVFLGEEEQLQGQFALKEMATGQQKSMGKLELLKFFNRNHKPGHGHH